MVKVAVTVGAGVSEGDNVAVGESTGRIAAVGITAVACEGKAVHPPTRSPVLIIITKDIWLALGIKILAIRPNNF